MKKSCYISVIFYIVFFTILVSTNVKAENSIIYHSSVIHIVDRDESEENRQIENAIHLPESLITIESNAFEGTALSSIELSDSLESIGDYAFANISTLKSIKIPNKTTFIGKNAFKGSNQVTITSAPKSYARAWAQENSIPFSPIASFYAYNKSVQVPSITGNNTALQKILLSDETIEYQNGKPTGRMTGELNASKYEDCIAFHIQGRSPPMA